MGNSVMLNGIEYAGEQIAYKDSTYELVSKVAYLIGVPLRIFQNEHEPPKIEIYNRLEQDKNARIIRNLCIIRTAIERNYRKINDIMRMEYRGLLSMPEIIPASSMQQLSNDGISFIKKSSTKLCHHIIEINRLISDRINNCKSLFPIWINWAYICLLYTSELAVCCGSIGFFAGRRLQLHNDEWETIDKENHIWSFFGVLNESPLIRNCELVTGRIFEVHKVNKGRAFFTLVIVFYRDSVLEVVHKDHVLLQKRSGFKVLELIDCLRQSGHRQALVDPLQGR